MKRETAIQRNIMVALSTAGCIVFRNEVGQGFVGKLLSERDGVIVLDTARRFRFGLHKGSSDIIGIAPDGRFLAVEVKTDKGRERPEQVVFREAVSRAGGIAYVARSPKEAVDLLTDALRGASA